MKTKINVYVVGCGGIGGFLCNLLPQTMACLAFDRSVTDLSEDRVSEILSRSEPVGVNHGTFSSLTLIDGDTFSPHNALRQAGTSGSKLIRQMQNIRKQDAFSVWLHTCSLKGYNNYVSPANMGKIFSGGTQVIFLCVDNHKTRYEVSRWAVEQNANILVINGGNEKTTGNVTVCENFFGKLLDPPIYEIYPEVNANADKRPDEIDCGAVTRSNDQTAVTNNMIASIMLAMFSKWVRTGGFDQKTRKIGKDGRNIVVRNNEVVVNFETMTMTPLSHSYSERKQKQSTVEGDIPEM